MGRGGSFLELPIYSLLLLVLLTHKKYIYVHKETQSDWTKKGSYHVSRLKLSKLRRFHCAVCSVAHKGHHPLLLLLAQSVFASLPAAAAPQTLFPFMAKC